MLKFPLTRLIDFLNLVQEILIGDEIPVARHDLFESDHALLVDDKVGALGQAPLRIQHSIGLHHLLPVGVAEQRIVQLEKIGKCLL